MEEESPCLKIAICNSHCTESGHFRQCVLSHQKEGTITGTTEMLEYEFVHKYQKDFV